MLLVDLIENSLLRRLPSEQTRRDSLSIPMHITFFSLNWTSSTLPGARFAQESTEPPPFRVFQINNSACNISRLSICSKYIYTLLNRVNKMYAIDKQQNQPIMVRKHEIIWIIYCSHNIIWREACFIIRIFLLVGNAIFNWTEAIGSRHVDGNFPLETGNISWSKLISVNWMQMQWVKDCVVKSCSQFSYLYIS